MLHRACRQDQQDWLPATVLRTVRPGQKLNEEWASQGSAGTSCGYANTHRGPEGDSGGSLPPVRIVLNSLRV